jgi:hypothetical protein
VPDTGDTSLPDPQLTKPRSRWWARIVGDVKRKLHERRVKIEHESAADSAARHTVFSTGLIAVFTIALACVGYLQFQEIRDSGIESSAQMDQMIHQYRSQVAQLKRQAGDTHDLAVAAGKQADQATIQAKASKVAAEAAKSAANTAKDALHVSERAILVVGDGTLKDDSKIFSVPLENVGRLPSGPVEVIVHSGTFNVPNSDEPIKASELIGYHWFKIKVQTIITSEPIHLMVDMPDTSFPNLRSGNQQFMVAGTVSYYDGFPDTPRQSFTFCRRTVYWPKLNLLAVQDCDGTAMLPFLKQVGNYPNHQIHTPSEDKNPN